jgi:hypothetical protein
MTPVILTDHIRREKSSKNVCVTAVLTALGVSVTAFRSTWTAKSGNMWPNVLRRNGFAVRSRASRLPKGCTVGKARDKIASISDDPAGTMYIVRVESHVLLLDSDGKTVVDTAPRKRDRRKVKGILAVWKR